MGGTNMSGKFMITKKIILPVMTAILLVSQLTGCAMFSSNEMVEMINDGESIVIEVNQPSTYDILRESGIVEDGVTWVQLDQLKTFNMGFRQGFDELFNINTITDVSQGTVGGKQGCIYVLNVDGQEMRSGNTTMEDAFRNKVFIEKYFSNEAVQTKLMALCGDAYNDIDENSPYALEATLNAYFNLLNDSKNPDSFNPTQSVTREEFYTMLFKATNGVRDLDYNASTDEFAKAVGGETEYTKYAKQVADYGFLTTENGSLDSTNIGTSISRAEAIYMIVQQAFPEEYARASERDSAFTDTENAGDLALRVGFKEEVKREMTNPGTGKTEKYTEIVAKDKWQAYSLAFMLKNPDKGMQSELYRAMVVAKEVGLINDSESRWDEVLSRAEAVELLMNTFMAKNDTFGYLTTSEYAEIDAPSDYSSTTEQGDYVVSTPDVGTNNINTTYTLDNLTAEHLEIFNLAIEGAADIINSGAMTIEELDIQQEGVIEALVYESVLPENGIELFREWKESTGYYAQFSGIEQPGTQGSNNSQGGNAQANNNTQSGTQVPVTPPSSKPTPTEDQKAQQDNRTSGEKGLTDGLTWENKEEYEQRLEDTLKDASGREDVGFVDLDPDFWN